MIKSTKFDQGGAGKRVGIWIRVSTEDQVKDESPEHHERRARYYAESKGWTIAQVYRLEGVSGKSVIAQSETQRMLADIQSGQITGLIFSKLARLARNTRELLDFAETFDKAGAHLISLQESIDTSTPAGRLFYTMIAAMAQWEREEISERIAASVPVRARMGKRIGGDATFGYQWKDKKLVPHPEEAPVRKLVHELFLEHRRKKVVARILNERGYRTRSGCKFSDTLIDRLLRDTTAKGTRRANYTRRTAEGWELKPESEWVLLEVEPVVSEELWNQCFQLLEARKVKTNRPAKQVVYLFAGFTICECGQKMYVPWKSAKYVCQTCRNKIPMDDLEAIFHDQLRAFLESPADVEQYLKTSELGVADKQAQLDVLEKDALKLRHDVDAIYQLYLAQRISQEEFSRRYDPLDVRLKVLDQELPRLQAEIDYLKITFLSSDQIVTEAQNLSVRWPDLTAEEKRRIVENITEKIVVGRGEVAIDLLSLPSPEMVANSQRSVPPPALPGP